MTSTPRTVVMVGPFGMRPRTTMRVRALPLAKALARRGYHITMLLPPWQNPEDSGRSWIDEDVRIENMALPKGWPGWFHYSLAARIARRARELAPDVIHAFKPKAYAGLVHFMLRRRFPVVVDTDDWEGPGGWNALAEYPAWMKRFFAWQERWGLKNADAVTVASRALETLTWPMGGTPDRVFYLPNGIQSQMPRTRSLNSGRPTLLLYTRFFEYELERLWRIIQLVRDQRPEVRLLVVGQGFAGEEDELLGLARRAGWRAFHSPSDVPEADLLYAGWGTEDTLSWGFEAADIAIYPFDDTLLNRTKCPMKLMDLLSAGIPVVADRVGQIGEVIVHGKTGFLVECGDDRAFARSILKLLEDSDLRRRMGAAAAADVAHRFDWDVLAETAVAAYDYAAARFI
ncbi:MAG: glycosyltransferase family 4 protein [Anaerolineae bacterium]